MNFYFPWWLSSRIVALYISSSPLQGLSFRLSFPRLVDRKAEIFLYARFGWVDGLIYLFREGKAYPADVQYSTGYTALSIAAMHGQARAVKLLLDAHADPYYEDRFGGTPADMVWNYINIFSGTKKAGEKLRGVFSDARQLERCQFSPLHRIVLKFVIMDLEPALTLSTTEIDCVDKSGRTALSWATERGDIDAVRVLLQYGANPNGSDVLGLSPLHYAYTPLQTKEFAAWGSDVEAWDQILAFSAVYMSCTRWEPNYAIIRLLLKHGADHTNRMCPHTPGILGMALSMKD